MNAGPGSQEKRLGEAQPGDSLRLGVKAAEPGSKDVEQGPWLAGNWHELHRPEKPTFSDPLGNALVTGPFRLLIRLPFFPKSLPLKILNPSSTKERQPLEGGDFGPGDRERVERQSERNDWERNTRQGDGRKMTA